MTTSAQMQRVGTLNGREIWFAEEGTFERPGLYAWDAAREEHIPFLLSDGIEVANDLHDAINGLTEIATQPDVKWGTGTWRDWAQGRAKHYLGRLLRKPKPAADLTPYENLLSVCCPRHDLMAGWINTQLTIAEEGLVMGSLGPRATDDQVTNVSNRVRMAMFAETLLSSARCRGLDEEAMLEAGIAALRAEFARSQDAVRSKEAES